MLFYRHLFVEGIMGTVFAYRETNYFYYENEIINHNGVCPADTGVEC
jgi:hypothetical protein